MSWKFWKKEQPESEPETMVRSIPFSTVYRWYCYDIHLENLDSLDSNMGLIPISEDAKDMEVAESLERLDAIAPLMPFLEIMSNLNATVLSESTMRKVFLSSGVENDSDEMDHIMDAMEALQAFVSHSALIAAFSSATALGLITVKETLISEAEHEYF